MYFQIDIYKLKQNKSFDDIQRLKKTSFFEKNPNFLETFRKLKMKYPLSYIYMYTPNFLTKQERLKSITTFLQSTRKL